MIGGQRDDSEVGAPRDYSVRPFNKVCSRRRLMRSFGLDVLSFEDPRWSELKAGYRTPIDRRPLLQRLESVQ